MKVFERGRFCDARDEMFLPDLFSETNTNVGGASYVLIIRKEERGY